MSQQIGQIEPCNVWILINHIKIHLIRTLKEPCINRITIIICAWYGMGSLLNSFQKLEEDETNVLPQMDCKIIFNCCGSTKMT